MLTNQDYIYSIRKCYLFDGIEDEQLIDAIKLLNGGVIMPNTEVGVFADNDLRPVLPAVVPAEIAADPECMIHCQVLVGLSAESVCTKIFTHFVSFFLMRLLISC